MPDGFFPQSEVLRKSSAKSEHPKCEACKLYKHCESPKMPVDGSGVRNVLFVGRSPSPSEDERGRAFSGAAAKHLYDVLRNMGFNLRRDAYLTNSIICAPTHNRKPTPEETEYCQPNVRKAIRETEPTVIVPLGTSAVRSVISDVWKENVGEIGRWAGYVIPSVNLNTFICPTYDPAEVMRDDSGLLGLYFAQHLQRAISFANRPYATPPDYLSQIDCIENEADAVDLIKQTIKRGDPFAFDYETNSLKPDHERAAIVSCSVRQRNRNAFAYIWTPRTAKATSRLLRTSIPKIAANMKFEDRWTRAKLGHPVHNLIWDTMLAAHVDDNRRGVTSVKFQAFVTLGMPSYDDHIKPLLQSRKGELVNRIVEEIGIHDLLTYNGLDSLLEYEIALRQTKHLHPEVWKVIQ